MCDIPDDLWDVIRETEQKYTGELLSGESREKILALADVKIFGGGCFLTKGPLFHLYILPEKRGGRWKIRTTVRDHINKLLEKYKVARVRIAKDNKASLRLAGFFGFKTIEEIGNSYLMEVHKWVL